MTPIYAYALAISPFALGVLVGYAWGFKMACAIHDAVEKGKRC